ncbi:hypothetical protein NL676_003044 [Syzygium grande]|nr:hypothetical protein NL676_003044 [Syzygium grande]
MKTFAIVWIAVCSTISVLIMIVVALNAVFAIRRRGRILGDGVSAGGHGETVEHDVLSSHFGGVFDGGASLESGGDMVSVGDFGGGSSISGADGGVMGSGDTGGGSGGGCGSAPCDSGSGGGGCVF